RPRRGGGRNPLRTRADEAGPPQRSGDGHLPARRRRISRGDRNRETPPSQAADGVVRSDLLVVSAAEIVTAPPGRGPLLGPELDRPLRIANASVACVDGRVAAVGPTADVLARFPEKEAARVLDATGRLVAPGFVDCHTHLPFAGTREMEFEARARGETYEAIAAKGGGIRSSVRTTRATSEADLTAAVSRRLAVLLAQGTTTVEAKSGYGLSLDEERKQLRAATRAGAASPVEVIPTFLGAHE